MGYFTRRREEKARLERENAQATAALILSRNDLNVAPSREADVKTLVDKLRALQQENHWAERLNDALGAK